ncbi:MAG: DUF2924 domain-containing protein [Phycisphaeraceae bacterium]|nr:DUF2924 domain-containing protein [Phycisphaeraceae bacterium]
MMRDVEQEIAALRGMTPTQLRGRYRELFGQESRSGNRQWLFRRCAWRVQMLAEGDLGERVERVRRRALEMADDADLRVIPPRVPLADEQAPRRVSRVAIRQERRLPLAGAELVRRFKGQLHVVKVLDDGFEYNNQRFRSLSAVAYAITGSHWNGYRFFQESLNYAKQPASEEARHG